MARGPEAAEAGRGRERAEKYPPSQARCQKMRAARAPRHDEVDMERHPNPKEQRQGDDVGKIQRLPDQYATAQGQKSGQYDRRHGDRYVAYSPQRDQEQAANGNE